tara:strand:- start:2410 stop:2826 length:417 start_codon:yes stop_codon:yes gene_type:complete
MATKVKSKGTALLMSISAVYTAIPLLKSISISGAASETFDARTLDQSGSYGLFEPNGYTSAPTISADGFRDPDDTTQQAFIALMVANPVIACNFQVTYTDGTPLSEVYSGAGFGFDTTAAMADGLACSYSIQTSGDPA